jgi:hypothetical protein
MVMTYWLMVTGRFLSPSFGNMGESPIFGGCQHIGSRAHRRFLIDQATLNISNRWRKERGETELRMSELSGNDTATS